MINMWTPDQVPELLRSGGQALANGVASAGHDLARGLSDAIDRKKKEGQLSQSLRKTLSILHPDRKPEFDSMGLGALQGESQAIAIQSHLAEQQSQQEERAARTGLLRHGLQQNIAEMGVPGAILGSAEAGIASPLNNESFDAAASTRSGLSPGALSLIRGFKQSGAALPAGVLDDLIRNQGGPSMPLTFQEDPKTGQRFALQKNTVLPSGINPDKQNMQGIPQYDEDGTTLLGHSFPNGKGGFVFKPQVDNTPHALIHPITGQPIPGFLNINGKAVDVRSIMEKAGLEQPPAPAAPGKTQQFKKGDKVRQGGVMYEFDGKDWKAVK